MSTYSEDRAELFKALSLFQGELSPALKTSKNPFYKSNYSDLKECVAVAKPLLPKHGLCVVQTTDYEDDGSVIIVTTLGHLSGQWMSGRLKMVPIKKDPQGYGSVITYGRRYSYCAMLGIASEDDDGNAASNKKVERQKLSADEPIDRVANDRKTWDIDVLMGKADLPENQLGPMLSQARKLKKLTQRGLAAKLDVTVKQVSLWESGQELPAGEMIPRIGAALGLKLDELRRNG